MNAQEAREETQKAKNKSTEQIYKNIKIRAMNGENHTYANLTLEQIQHFKENGYELEWKEILSEYKISW